jgi:hypothetical protein
MLGFLRQSSRRGASAERGLRVKTESQSLLPAKVEATPNLETIKSAECVEINLNRDNFLRELIRRLSGALQDVVGVSEAAGFSAWQGKALATS